MRVTRMEAFASTFGGTSEGFSVLLAKQHGLMIFALLRDDLVGVSWGKTVPASVIDAEVMRPLPALS